MAEEKEGPGPGPGSESSGRPDAGADPDADGAGVAGAGQDARAGASGARAPEVVVALDYPDAEQARETVRLLPPGTWYKVGLELFTAAGPDFVRELTAAGHPVFLDLKLHDIPATVEGTVRAAAGLGARLLTVHASGGREMIAAADRAAAEAGAAGGGPAGEGGEGGRTRILAVTVLTSLDDAAYSEVVGQAASAHEVAGRLAVMARDAGADGTVASVAECAAIKAACGEDFRVATPGIRLAGGETHDQKRVATPDEAAAAGSDFLVVGRAITRADDPGAALRTIRALAAGGRET